MTVTSSLRGIAPLSFQPDENWPKPGAALEPAQYSPMWLLLGIAALLAIVAYFAIVALLTRRRMRTVRTKGAHPPVDLTKLQQQSLEKVDEIERAARHREISQRTASEQLSEVVRDYVTAMTEIPADKMTLEQLRQSPLRATADAVAQFYPAVFAATPPHNFERSLQAARQVLAGCP